MATKVTLSSPPVQHQLLHDPLSVDGHHHQHEQPPPPPPPQQQQQLDHHYGQTDDPLSGYNEYAHKRPPTPPKPKQQVVPSWKQHRLSAKPKDANNVNGYYPDSPDPSQSTTTTPNTSNQKKASTLNKSSNAYDYDYQQYMYHQQALMAESNKKGHIQQPPPSLKKHKDQLTELFMVQEQLDQASRERDRVLEENTQLRYHLQVLHFRMQNAEYMWQSYNAAAAAQLWDDGNNNNNNTKQQRQHYSFYPFDSIGPPLDFISNRSLPDQQRQFKSQQQHSEDEFRDGHRQRFRRYRSKSLPRKTSLADNNNDTPYSLHQSMMMYPPPMFSSSMMAKLPIPPPPPPPMFDRPPPPPPPFGPRMHNNTLLDPIMDGNREGDGDDDDDDDENSDSGDMDGINTMRQRRGRQMYNDGGFMTDGPPPPPPLSMLSSLPLPPPPPPPPYPMYRYHQNTSSRSLPIGLSPFGHQHPSYYPGDDNEDKWDQRSVMPPAPFLDRPPYDYVPRPTNRLNMYSREEMMQNNNTDPHHYQQQPWMTSDPSLKLGLASKQPSSYGDPLLLLQQQQQQHAFYSPRHRRGPKNSQSG